MNSIVSNDHSLRSRVAALLENSAYQCFILTVIIVNAVVLGLQTSAAVMREAGEVIERLDQLALIVFVIEIALRLYVHRSRFFHDPWSLFDLIVISAAMIPSSTHISVLRALRVLRVLRVVTVAPAMRRVVGALLAAIPGLWSIALVLMLIFYVFAVIATHVFGTTFPAWFGHVGRSLYTLFQVMTLESWSMGISRPVMESFPYAWTFFVPFILIATFTMLNLFIAVIVTATQTFADEERADEERADEGRAGAAAAVAQGSGGDEASLQTEVRALRAEIATLSALVRERSGPV